MSKIANTEDNDSYFRPEEIKPREHLKVKSPNCERFYKKRDYSHGQKGVLFGLPFTLISVVSFILFYIYGTKRHEAVSRFD